MRVSQVLELACKFSNARICGVQKVVGFDLNSEFFDLSPDQFAELKEALE